MMAARLALLVLVACLVGPAAADAADAGGWTGPERVGPASVIDPKLAVRANGEAVAVWQSDRGGLVAALRRSSGGWTRLQTLVRIGDLDLRDEQVAMAADGTAVAVWTQRAPHPAPLLIKASVRPPGGRFGRPVTIGRASRGDVPRPRLTLRGHMAAVVWPSGKGTKLVWYSRRGGFRPPRRMPWGAPVAATLDPSGRLRVIFTRPRSSESCPDNTVWTTRGRYGGRFSTPDRVSRGSAMDLAVAVARDGDTIAAWRRLACDDGAEPPGATTVRAAVGREGGRLGVPQTLTPPGRGGLNPRLAVGPRGDAVVTWEVSTLSAWREPIDFAWVAVRPARGAFGNAQSLAPPGLTATRPALAVDRHSIATAAFMARPDVPELRVARGPTDAPLPAPVTLATASPSRAGDHAFSTGAAAAGDATVVLWSRGPGDELVAFVAEQ